ncbi:hypothetical protein ANTPLA_LOCUS10689 [Anthophora plagiata]
MRKEINSRNVHKDLMSASYNESIQRITGVKDSVKYEIPTHILERRQHFWDMFFDKYSEKISEEKEVDILTLKVYENKPKYKSLNYIQHWVNTGYLSYKTDESCIVEDETFENSLPSKTKECLQLLHHDVKKETLDAQCTKQKYGGNSSSSSVNTATYILANMNATNKAKTMAIVEGANTLVTSRNTRNIQTTKLVTDKICAKKCEHIALDNSSTNYQKYLPIPKMSECVLQRNRTDENKNITQMQKNLVTNMNTLSETLNVNDKLEHNNKFCCNQLLDETLPRTISDDKTGNSYTKCDSLNAKLSQISENNFVSEKSTIQDSTIKHRKRLYTVTDSPTDLTQMQHSNKNILFKSQSNLHPALDFKCKLKQHKLFKMRKKSLFHTFNRSLMSNCQLNRTRSSKRLERTNNSIFNKTSIVTNNNKISNDAHSMNPNKSQDLIECKTTKCTNTFLSTNESINAQKKSNKSTIYLEKCKPNENRKPNIVTDELIRLNPSVYLTRISEVDIQKYKNSNKVTTNSCGSNDNHKHRNKYSIVSNLKDLDLKVPFISLPKLNIQKLEKQHKTMETFKNLNPVVRLKRLSEFEIQKYKKSAIIIENFGNLNPTVQLKKLSDFDIQKYTNGNNKEVVNRNDLLSETGKNENVNIHPAPNFLSNIINVSDKDSSDESTLIIYKCENIDSNISILSETFKSVNSHNEHVSEISEKLNTSVFDTIEDEEKSTVRENITIRTSSNIFQNDERNRQRITRSQLTLNASKRNSTHKKMCRTRNRKMKKTRSTKKPSLFNSRNSNLRKSLLLKKNVYEPINDATSLSVLETLSRSSCSSDAPINNNKKLNMLLFSDDEDNEFVKLIYCPEESRLGKDFVEKTDSDKCNTSNDIIISISSQGFPNGQETFSSMKSKCFKELKSNNNSRSLSYFNGENLHHKNLITKQSCDSSVKEDYSSQLTRKQIVLKDGTKLLPNMDIVSDKNKSGVSNWRFETKLFDSDSFTFSSSSSNISFNDKE